MASVLGLVLVGMQQLYAAALAPAYSPSNLSFPNLLWQGGLGPMSRMWGSCLDHIVEVEVVIANGSILRASTTQNPDLFYVRIPN